MYNGVQWTYKELNARANRLARLLIEKGAGPEDVKMAQTGAVSFDASTFEVFGALLNGGTLYPVPKETLLDGKRFRVFLEETGITTMWLTSPLFNQPAQQDPRWVKLPAHLGKGLPKRQGPARRQGSRQYLAGQRPRPFRHHQLQLASGHLPTP